MARSNGNGRRRTPTGARKFSPLLLLLVFTPLQIDIEQASTASDPRFGLVETYHEPDIADELGVGWTRILFYWSELEREGPDDWNEFHAPIPVLEREIAGGREVVGLLAHTPAWATDGIPGAGVPRGLYLSPDDPDNLWAGFVRETLTRYNGLVSRWIIWNEPDIALDTYGAQWQGTTEDYYQLVKTAYIVAHEVNPDAQIHLGGLTFWHNPTYLREFLAVASADPTAIENDYYFDVVSLHIYFKPETTPEIVNAIRMMLAERGLEDKPIWINETNAPPYDDPTQPWIEPVYRVTQQMQASFLLQQFALALALDAERIAVYKLVDEPPLQPGFEPYGLLRHDRTPRPAYEAFRVILKHYAHTEAGSHITASELQTVILDRGEQVTRVFWARRPYLTLAITPALSDSALRVNQTGLERAIRPVFGSYFLWLQAAPCPRGQECLMGGPPILLIEQVAVDLAQTEGLDNRVVIDFTPLTLTAMGSVLVGTGGMAAAIVHLRARRISQNS